MSTILSAARQYIASSFTIILAVSVTIATVTPSADAARRRNKRKASDPAARMEYKANDMIDNGVEFLVLKQEERGIKLITAAIDMYPNSKARFRARLELAKHYMARRSYDHAIRQLGHLRVAPDAEKQAEAFYRIGLCYYEMDEFDKAFVALRTVTTQFPWSAHTNDAYFYIGQCHFKLKRWARALAALEMVGASTTATSGSAAVAEAGHRLFIKITDKDLVVLHNDGAPLMVTVKSGHGDEELIALSPAGREGDVFLGSLDTTIGVAIPGDGVLQFLGSDTATVQYTDVNTAVGRRNQTIVATVRLLSTASLGFTDGAYREYTEGVFLDSPAFVRLTDSDLDVSDKADTTVVRVMTQYTVSKGTELGDAIDDIDPMDEIRRRDTRTIQLTETGPHTGVFVGTVIARSLSSMTDSADNSIEHIVANHGDEIVVEYEDREHSRGREPRQLTRSVAVLAGQIQDVKVEHREVTDRELRAKKQLIEARIFLKLAAIFKEVGLRKNANEKAEEGLRRADAVIRMGSTSVIERDLVEHAFNVKWDLLLVQDRLQDAITVCRALTRLFPDSTLVDKALLRIGVVKMDVGTAEALDDAVRIFSSILQLDRSELKAEAQFRIAEVVERHAIVASKPTGKAPNLGRAMVAYSECVETYPESPFAGEALEKIVNYHLRARDNVRALALIERIFRDYPDARFLDKMLLKWVIAAFRTGNYRVALEKAEQLMSEYPNSPHAEKALEFSTKIGAKIAKDSE